MIARKSISGVLLFPRGTVTATAPGRTLYVQFFNPPISIDLYLCFYIFTQVLPGPVDVLYADLLTTARRRTQPERPQVLARPPPAASARGHRPGLQTPG